MAHRDIEPMMLDAEFLERLVCVPVTTNGHAVLWQASGWRTNQTVNDWWIDFNREDNILLNAAYESKIEELSFPSRHEEASTVPPTTWTINFQALVQRNNVTGATRRIRRVVVHNAQP